MLTIAESGPGSFMRVADLAAMPRKQQPACSCVSCGARLIAKLGARVKHHFAHRPGSTCPAAGGEGELHLEAKLQLQMRLAEAANAGECLRCDRGCRRCERSCPAPFLQLHPADHVVVERRLDRYRPDVSILRDGNPIAAFEVLVTHACDEEKWRTLRKRGTAVVELLAVDIVGTATKPPWSAQSVLSAARMIGAPRRGRCSACTAEREAAQRRPRDRKVVQCLVNVRYRDGRRYSDLFEAIRHWDGTCWARGEIRSRRRGTLCTLTQAEVQSPGTVRTRAREIYRGFRTQTLTSPVESFTQTVASVGEEEVEDLLSTVPDELWWAPTRRKWVRCYSWKELPRVLGVPRFSTLARWYRNGRLKTVHVQRMRGGEYERLYDAQSIDGLARWLQRRREADREQLDRIFGGS